MFSPVSVGIFPEKVYLSVRRHFQRISCFGRGGGDFLGNCYCQCIHIFEGKIHKEY